MNTDEHYKHAVVDDGFAFLFKFLNTRAYLPWLNAADVQYNRIVTTIHVFSAVTFIFLRTLTKNINTQKIKTNQLLLNDQWTLSFYGLLYVIIKFAQKRQLLILFRFND